MNYLLGLLLLTVPLSSLAVQEPTFAPPTVTPETNSSTAYAGGSNGTLSNPPLVPGKYFDRFVQIWLENTDFQVRFSLCQLVLILICKMPIGRSVFQNLPDSPEAGCLTRLILCFDTSIGAQLRRNGRR